MTDIAEQLYGGADNMARVMYGQDARHVPVWLYVQDQGPGLVSMVGASMTRGRDNPLTYGGGHWDKGEHGPAYYPHYFIAGEVIVRPHVVIGTNTLKGMGLAGLAIGCPDIEGMLTDGALVAGSVDMLARYARKATQ